MRGVGISEALNGFPDAVVLLFGLLTQLGDTWFLLSALTLLYWFTPQGLLPRRRDAATLLALAVTALMLVAALKVVFDLPRPPGATTVTPPTWLPAVAESTYTSITTGDGFGFPSGHALGATVVYGGAASLLRVGTRRVRAAAAAAVVFVVAVSRLVLGVHYLVDVVVGIAVGLALLAAVFGTNNRHPERVFALAALLSVVAVVAAENPHAVRDAFAGLGAALGGLVAWRTVGESEVRVPGVVAVVAVAVVGAFAGGLFYLGPPPLVFVAAGVAFGVVVALPSLVELTRKRRRRAGAGST